MSRLRQRVRRIFEHADEDVDAIVFLNAVAPHLDMSFFYVTDLVGGGLFERSAAVCWPDGRVEVITSPLEEPSARHGAADVTVVDGPDERRGALHGLVGGLDRVGINGAEAVHQSVEELRHAAPEAELVDVADAVRRARLVKDDAEIARMRRAGDIVSAIADEIPGLLREGLTESELAAEINHRMQKRGASEPSFSTIVGFGPGSAEPHYSTADAPLERGQFALTDFGAYVQRYASDLTRTYVLGEATKEMRDMYETVLEAQRLAIEAMQPGAKGGDVHLAAADHIDGSRWKGRFIHSTGHSLGIAVHDGGALHPRHDVTLEEGMVFTVEPGVYVPEIGGVRIEDDVLVTADGPELLTSARKAWDDIVVG